MSLDQQCALAILLPKSIDKKLKSLKHSKIPNANFRIAVLGWKNVGLA